MGLWDERLSRYYSIVWLRELVLRLLEALTAGVHRLIIATLVDVGNPVSWHHYRGIYSI